MGQHTALTLQLHADIRHFECAAQSGRSVPLELLPVDPMDKLKAGQDCGILRGLQPTQRG